MKKIGFIPRYGFFQTYFVLLWKLVAVVMLFFGLFQGFNIGSLVLLVLFLYSFLSDLLTLPRMIVLSTDRVVVKRLFWSDLILFYDEFTSFGDFSIDFGKKHIWIYEMNNSKELKSLFSDLVKEGKIEDGKFTFDTLNEQLAKDSFLSALPSLVICPFILFVLYSYTDLTVDFGEFVFVETLVFVLTYVTVLSIKKHISSKNIV